MRAYLRAVAVELGNSLSLPVLCVFGLDASYPQANLRHYAFMLEGLRETRENLEARGVQLAVVAGTAHEIALSAASEASLLVCDRGYMRHQKNWRRAAAERCSCRVLEVEGDVVVPVDLASGKREWSAATLRPRIHRLLADFLDIPRPRCQAGQAAGPAWPFRSCAPSWPKSFLTTATRDTTRRWARSPG
jgi:deoxyribodipyrimidine photo-lyase